MVFKHPKLKYWRNYYFRCECNILFASGCHHGNNLLLLYDYPKRNELRGKLANCSNNCYSGSYIHQSANRCTICVCWWSNNLIHCSLQQRYRNGNLSMVFKCNKHLFGWNANNRTNLIILHSTLCYFWYNLLLLHRFFLCGWWLFND